MAPKRGHFSIAGGRPRGQIIAWRTLLQTRADAGVAVSRLPSIQTLSRTDRKPIMRASALSRVAGGPGKARATENENFGGNNDASLSNRVGASVRRSDRCAG